MFVQTLENSNSEIKINEDIGQSFKNKLYKNNAQKEVSKKIINNLITAKQLPYRLFRDHYSLIVKMAYPENKIQVVFESFRLISKNFTEEFAPRILWWELNKYQSANIKTIKMNNTQCGITRVVLETALFGRSPIVDDSVKVETRDLQSPLKENLVAKLRIIARNNFSILQNENPSFFYAYSFCLASKDCFPGHGFVIVQCVDKEKKPFYHFFQSYVNEYALKDYMKEVNNRWDQLEFDNFVNGLESCTSTEKWTDSNNEFFWEYFRGPPNIRIGTSNPCSTGQFLFTYAKRNVQKFAILNEEFQSSKKTFSYPRFKKNMLTLPPKIHAVACQGSEALPMQSEEKMYENEIPKILIIEANKANAEGVPKLHVEFKREEIAIGLNLLEPFSEEEICNFYDRYWPLVRDGLRFFSGAEISWFYSTILSLCQLRSMKEKDSEDLIEFLITNLSMSLLYDEENHRFCSFDPKFVFQKVISLFRQNEIDKIIKLPYKDSILFFKNLFNEQQNFTFYSKKEMVGILFFILLSLLMDKKEILERKQILLEGDILFPFKNNEKFESLEKLIFLLFFHALSKKQESPPQAIQDYSKDAEHLKPYISLGSNLYTMKLRSLDPHSTCDYDLSPLMLNSRSIIKKYPHLKACFFNSILAPITMHSTFETSQILSVDQKKQLQNYRNNVLDLYQNYFKTSISNKPSIEKKKRTKNPYNMIFDSSGECILKFLESIHHYPDLFSKLVDYQLQSMQDQLNPHRLVEDTKKGNLCFLPHVDVNTPFGLLQQFSSEFNLEIILQHMRSYREFILLLHCFFIIDFHSLSKEQVFAVVENFTKNIDHLFIDELYEELRLMKDDAKREKFIKMTGLPDIIK